MTNIALIVWLAGSIEGVERKGTIFKVYLSQLRVLIFVFHNRKLLKSEEISKKPTELEIGKWKVFLFR